MNGRLRVACILAIGCVALGNTGCSSKAVKSSGDTSFAASSSTGPILSETDLPNTQRMSPGMAMPKVDPVERKRQMEEARMEQRATAAAGLSDVYFGYDSWTISEEGRQALSRDAEWLRIHPAVQLKVEGHCDDRGSSTYNFVLAEKRAKSVRNYLMELGVKRDRVIVVAYGKERPFCHDRSEACYRQNRRGHLVVKQ
jgi:peptidoglycan-associated lipoprotein